MASLHDTRPMVFSVLHNASRSESLQCCGFSFRDASSNTAVRFLRCFDFQV